MKWIGFVAVAVVRITAGLDNAVAAFVPHSKSSFIGCNRSSRLMSTSSRNTRHHNMFMFQCDSLQSLVEMPGSMKNTVASDTTTIGNLVVPSIGVGTISWSSESCE